MEKELQGKRALVTGASSGIGRAIAIELGSRGARVGIAYHSSVDGAEETRRSIVDAGGEAKIIQLDVTDEDSVVAAFTQVEEVFGGLDILVNNAGIDIEAELADCTRETWDKILHTNLTGKFLCIKHATPMLKKGAGAVIINVASRMGSKPVPEIVPYCVSQAGVLMLTQGAALELAPYGIRVNSVSPGLTRTPLTEKLVDEAFFESYVERHPLGRLGVPEDIAKTVAFLASDDASYITGENVNVSGGILLT